MQRFLLCFVFLLFAANLNADDVGNFKKQYKELLKKVLVERYSHVDSSNIEVDILFIPKKISKILPVDNDDIRFDLPIKLNRLIGKLVVPTYIDKKKYNIIVQNKIQSSVVVAKKDIKKYDIFSVDNLLVQLVDLSKAPFGYYTERKGLLGKEAVISISKGAILVSKMVSSPTIAKRGNEVQLVAKVDSVTVICKGKILRDARKNDVVWVENLDSKKRLKGVLIDNNTVLIK